MAKKIILLRGLPASGKSTWARKYQEENPNTVRVNKDDLRAMLHNNIWSSGREDFILKVRNFIVEEALKNGHDVIVDDTNLHSKHKNTMWQIAAKYNAVVETQNFTDVSIEECVKRDLKRPNSVGKDVIMKMYRQFLKPTPPVIGYDPKLPDCIICDLDGTLCLFGDENPYDRDFSKDVVNFPVAKLLEKFKDEYIILFSGRNGKYREVTEKWLNDNDIYWSGQLHMRDESDKRKDSIVKLEMYEKHIKGKYNVLFIIDDRNQVVEMWRDQGLTVLQVAEGDF